ncbi:MAG: aspartyl protease family protein [Alphaproteobacteria bacterium]|nr:aspartyl protease family protein [Alphaproteobacteria bacterium]
MKKTLMAATVWLALAGALAAQEAPVGEVVDRYRSWRGGAAFEALDAVRLEGRIEASGLQGTLVVLAEADGDMRRDQDLGVVRSVSARHGAGGWVLTNGGQIEALSPHAAEDLRRDALLRFEGVLDDPSRLSRRPDVVVEGRTLAVIAVDFGPDADEHELWIDPQTGELYGVRTVRDRRESVVTFGDWRVVDGVRMPFLEQITDETGAPGEVRWSVVDLDPTVETSAWARPDVTAAHRMAAEGAPDSGAIRFDLYAGTRIYIPATVNGTQTEVLLDSGAEMTVLDLAFAESLGLELEGEVAAVGTGGVGEARFARGVAVDLGGIAFVDRTVAVIDLAAIAQALGRPLPVILGKDAFNALVVDIDFPARSLTFHEPAGYVPPEGATELALVSSGAIRAVPVSIEGRPPVLFDFDTGNGGALILYPAYAEAEGLLDGRSATTVMSGAVGGVRESGLATIGSLEIGGFEVSDIPTVFPPAGPSAVDADRTAGNIGMGVLGRFRLVTDFASNRLWLSATPEALAAPFAKDRLGLGIRLDSGVIVVTRVSPGSPAEGAGLVAPARIVAVDGRPAAEMDAAALRAMLTSPAGREVVLTLEDGTTVTLVAREFY